MRGDRPQSSPPTPAKRKLVWAAQRLIRVVFYRYVFGRKVPFAGDLTRVISAWDTPVQETWEAQYATGEWTYLRRLEELARYSVIIGYIQLLKPNSAILDVGCGEGILFHRIRPYGYSRYVGVDVSSVAISGLASEQNAQTSFIVADAEAYVPQEQFDVIVFNEVLYYFHNPLEAIGRYTQALRGGGVVVVSTYTGYTKAMAILRQMKAMLSLLDEVRVVHGPTSWRCSVFTAKPASKVST